MVKNSKPSKSWLSYDNEPVLRQKCLKIDVNKLTNKDLNLIEKMQSYIDCSLDDKLVKELKIVPGIAIAANQLGVSKQMVYIHFLENDKEYRYFLMNPRIVSSSVSKTYLPQGEGCLSVLHDHEGVSIRYKKVKVKAYDYLNQKEIEINADGLLAICLQHEIDHLNGLLYYDRITGEEDHATPYQPIINKERNNDQHNYKTKQ